MGTRSKARELTETNLGQHVALSVAAHLARTQLVPDRLEQHDAQRLLDILSRVGAALAKVAPLYVQDAKTTDPRELTPAELEGAAVRQGASNVVLRDGRTLAGVSMKRADLRQAISILKSLGVQSVAGPRAPARGPEAAPPDRFEQLEAWLAELEQLLRPPCVPAELEKANRLAVSIARNSPHGCIANRAMQLMSALQQAREGDGPSEIGLALARLRHALDDARASAAPIR